MLWVSVCLLLGHLLCFGQIGPQAPIYLRLSIYTAGTLDTYNCAQLVLRCFACHVFLICSGCGTKPYSPGASAFSWSDHLSSCSPHHLICHQHPHCLHWYPGPRLYLWCSPYFSSITGHSITGSLVLCSPAGAPMYTLKLVSQPSTFISNLAGIQTAEPYHNHYPSHLLLLSDYSVQIERTRKQARQREIHVP